MSTPIHYLAPELRLPLVEVLGMRRPHGEVGDVVLGWLTKISIALALLGLVGYELISLGVTRVNTQELAGEVARAGSEVFQRSRDVQQAYLAGSVVAAEGSGVVAPEDFTVEADGTVSVTVCREASSLLLHRTKRTRKWLKTCETARAKFV